MKFYQEVMLCELFTQEMGGDLMSFFSSRPAFDEIKEGCVSAREREAQRPPKNLLKNFVCLCVTSWLKIEACLERLHHLYDIGEAC